MNLRELVAALEVGGKPTFSEEPVKILTEDGVVYSVVDVEFESAAADVEAATVWLKVEEEE